MSQYITVIRRDIFTTLSPEASRLWSIRSRLSLSASAAHSYAVARAFEFVNPFYHLIDDLRNRAVSLFLF